MAVPQFGFLGMAYQLPAQQQAWPGMADAFHAQAMAAAAAGAAAMAPPQGRGKKKSQKKKATAPAPAFLPAGHPLAALLQQQQFQQQQQQQQQDIESERARWNEPQRRILVQIVTKHHRALDSKGTGANQSNAIMWPAVAADFNAEYSAWAARNNYAAVTYDQGQVKSQWNGLLQVCTAVALPRWGNCLFCKFCAAHQPLTNNPPILFPFPMRSAVL